MPSALPELPANPPASSPPRWRHFADRVVACVRHIDVARAVHRHAGRRRIKPRGAPRAVIALPPLPGVSGERGEGVRFVIRLGERRAHRARCRNQRHRDRHGEQSLQRDCFHSSTRSLEFEMSVEKEAKDSLNGD